MRISDERRFLFIHVQKTGGITIARLLDQHVPDSRSLGPGFIRHHGIAKALEIEPDLRHYWIFGFVRNPWARMVSWYTMISNVAEEARLGRPRVARKLERNQFWQQAAAYETFEDFVLRGTEELPRLQKPQLDYLEGKRRRADFIGRTESFAADLRAVFARLELPVPDVVPHKNKSGHGDYRDYYTDKSRDRVAEVFRSDLEAFSYDF